MDLELHRTDFVTDFAAVVAAQEVRVMFGRNGEE